MVAASFIPARGPGAADTVSGLYGNPSRDRITEQMQSLFDNKPLSSQIRKKSVQPGRLLFTYKPNVFSGFDGTKACSMRDVKSLNFCHTCTVNVHSKLDLQSLLQQV